MAPINCELKRNHNSPKCIKRNIPKMEKRIRNLALKNNWTYKKYVKNLNHNLKNKNTTGESTLSII